MSLRYVNRPYAGARDARSQVDQTLSRLPQGVQSMTTAPMASATPVLVWDVTGKAEWALHHRDQWKAVKQFKNPDQSVSWRMDGSVINHPIAWRAR
jgi:hypothetical protein